MSIPQLADGADVLRPWEETDVPALVEAMRDPEIPRWLPLIPQPYGPEEARRYVAWSKERWKERRGFHVAVTDARSGTVLGSVGMDFDLEDESGSVGYWVTPAARGRGIATRATRLIAGWGVDSLGLSRLELLAEVQNVASQKVAEKAGFRRECLLRSKVKQRTGRSDAYLYCLLAEDKGDQGSGDEASSHQAYGDGARDEDHPA